MSICQFTGCDAKAVDVWPRVVALQVLTVNSQIWNLLLVSSTFYFYFHSTVINAAQRTASFEQHFQNLLSRGRDGTLPAVAPQGWARAAPWHCTGGSHGRLWPSDHDGSDWRCSVDPTCRPVRLLRSTHGWPSHSYTAPKTVKTLNITT